MIHILLVDEYASVRQGVRMRLSLEPDFTVVGEAGDSAEARQLVVKLQPDVIVTDIRFQDVDGIVFITRLRSDFPNCAVVVLSLRDDLSSREQTLQAGAMAFVSKQEPDSKLLEAIRSAARAA